MNENTQHITPYRTIVTVLVALLGLLFLNLTLALVDIGKWNILGILLIASIQVLIVLNWFMHLNHAKWYLKVMVGAVFMLIAVVIAITFLDYLRR